MRKRKEYIEFDTRFKKYMKMPLLELIKQLEKDGVSIERFGEFYHYLSTKEKEKKFSILNSSKKNSFWD